MCGLCLAYVLLFWIGGGVSDGIDLWELLVEHLELYVQRGTLRHARYASLLLGYAG